MWQMIRVLADLEKSLIILHSHDAFIKRGTGHGFDLATGRYHDSPQGSVHVARLCPKLLGADGATCKGSVD
jgi:hypothetical protein